MKETIYTIPINEAYENDSECPLCDLEKSLEKESVEYSLGAAMMEPDFRIESNEKGYCRHHFSQMFNASNKLPLALILDTHLDQVRKDLAQFDKTAKNLKNSKSGFFKKSNDDILKLKEMLGKKEHSCIICDKINHTMQRYIDVLLYMYSTDDEFKAKFDNSKGVCMKHFCALIENAPKSIKGKKADLFISNLIEKESAELSRIQDDIHKFTLKFDYRNSDMEWGTAKDAPIRTIEKLSGYIKTE